MPMRQQKYLKLLLLFTVLCFFMAGGITAKEKSKHPFDLFDHEMHTGFFESENIPCETCHADPESFEKREKINRLGCHKCHNSQEPLMPGATQECKVCHLGGKFPKPESHKAGWIAKHESYAKQNSKECTQCHSNAMFCIDCHKRRDTIQQRMHGRNFQFYHSIEARANPRKCDACHRVEYCQQCHAGRGNSKK
ncbi:MAG: hypothetical protein A3H42_06800 [Deltaproteobacteria bacterium RIFCSPLOWO2_02_FULL_46_8]|nr:MAG: hypothetical protein A3H42_06800 [Deltaproteobacteria bacterium RIFCSPLOWO2_02_FULL_46_8]